MPCAPAYSSHARPRTSSSQRTLAESRDCSTAFGRWTHTPARVMMETSLDTNEGGEMIKKVKGGYKVLSESGKNLGGPYKSKSQAEKRLRQVEFFKHRKG